MDPSVSFRLDKSGARSDRNKHRRRWSPARYIETAHKKSMWIGSPFGKAGGAAAVTAPDGRGRQPLFCAGEPATASSGIGQVNGDHLVSRLAGPYLPTRNRVTPAKSHRHDERSEAIPTLAIPRR
jgi:hypothetical protein